MPAALPPGSVGDGSPSTGAQVERCAASPRFSGCASHEHARLGCPSSTPAGFCKAGRSGFLLCGAATGRGTTHGTGAHIRPISSHCPSLRLCPRGKWSTLARRPRCRPHLPRRRRLQVSAAAPAEGAPAARRLLAQAVERVEADGEGGARTAWSLLAVKLLARK